MSAIETSRDGAILTITLNRPDKLNAFDTPLLRGLGAALQDAADPAIRAVVITGAGRGFCVGQDLTALEEAGTETVTDLLRELYHPNMLAIRALEKPVIAAVNGPAAGAGLSLACSCDIRIASTAASFVPAFVSIGLVPDAGGTWFVSRLLGAPRAYDWLASGRPLKPDEALAWGLVSEVVPADGFAARIAEIATEAATRPTRSIGLMKQLFDAAPFSTLADSLEQEAVLQGVAVRTQDFAEGVAAFRDKRKAAFEGR